MRKCLFVMLILGMWSGTATADLYRSIDKDGKVHYGDSPLQGTEDVERLKSAREPAPDNELSYEARRAQERFPVTLYVFDSCGEPCAAARQMLSQRGIPYAEKSLNTKEEIDAFTKASGKGSAPAVSIGHSWLHGFQANQWHKELDVAGYPKTAGYRPTQPGKDKANAAP